MFLGVLALSSYDFMCLCSWIIGFYVFVLFDHRIIWFYVFELFDHMVLCVRAFSLWPPPHHCHLRATVLFFSRCATSASPCSEVPYFARVTPSTAHKPESRPCNRALKQLIQELLTQRSGCHYTTVPTAHLHTVLCSTKLKNLMPITHSMDTSVGVIINLLVLLAW